MRNLAWEITDDDIITVLRKFLNYTEISEDTVDRAREELDEDEIINNLLTFDGIYDQTNSMFEDIEKQLKVANFI